MKNAPRNYQPMDEEDEKEERQTFESRLDDLKYAVSDMSVLASHIHGILFGPAAACGEPLEDDEPSLRNTLYDIERHVSEARKTLEEVAEGLSSKDRLRMNS